MTSSPDSLRIIHVFRAPLGGLFRHVMDVAREQVARGHQVGIFCDSTTGGARTDSLLAELSPHLTLGLVRIPIYRNPNVHDISALRAFQRYVEANQPDVVHGHGSKGGVFARLPAFLEGKARAVRAYTPHGGSFNYKPGSFVHSLYMLAERLMEKRTDVFLFESAFIKSRFDDSVGATNKTVRVVLNGITEEEFTPVVPVNKPYDLLYLGELRNAKGIDTLLQALPQMRTQEGIIPTLLVIGSGPDEAELKSMVSQLNLQSFVVFEGPGPIRQALERARIMVVPSRAELLPYVILEAAAAAQPLVATNVGGIPEIFGPFSSELIVPDNSSLLAQTVSKKLQQESAELAERAHELRSFVQSRFTLKAMVDGVLEGYASVMQ